jgi:hypothetical protein
MVAVVWAPGWEVCVDDAAGGVFGDRAGSGWVGIQGVPGASAGDRGDGAEVAGGDAGVSAVAALVCPDGGRLCAVCGGVPLSRAAVSCTRQRVGRLEGCGGERGVLCDLSPAVGLADGVLSGGVECGDVQEDWEAGTGGSAAYAL